MEIEYLVIGGVGFLAVVFFILFSKMQSRLDHIAKKGVEEENATVLQLSQRVDSLSQQVSESLQKVTDTVLKQLGENTRQVDSRLEASQRNTIRSDQEVQKIVREVTSKLASMQESNQKIFEVGKDIASLQEILRAPKLRGTIGELFLGDLLAQIFPKNRYELQYTFKSGESVDAILRLRDNHIVPIDAKFPLESFQRMISAQSEDQKKIEKREFIKSVKKRVDEIAGKYIVADEGTLDFALMYIPAENVYYETILKSEEGNDIIAYAYSKKVIPVSPNNLYVYLQTIAMGLRGMQIEERAKEILHDLSRLNSDFQKVLESYEILGRHLSNANTKYDDTSRLLGKFGSKVEQIEDKTGEQSNTPVLTEG